MVRAFSLSPPTLTIGERPEIRWRDAAGQQHVVVPDERTVIGSSPSAGIVIVDPTVSRLHAEIDPREDGVWIRDLDSRNGTYVEEVLVGSARVPDGGSVRLGSTVLTVRYSRMANTVELWPSEQFYGLVGRSAKIRALFARAARVAAKDAPVLITGETGTGKELVANAIHAASARAPGPYVVVDCAALPENLLEAELFGHARGAFTGAVAARAGAFESAEGGTVFLDEIGELPLAMQPKLLRVLESRTVRRVGETEYRKVNVRFISATHRDLRKMVNAGAFREDLYFRLAVLPITVPPLRERPEDIPALVAHFLHAHGGEQPSPDLLRELMKRPWLGNVRELRSFVERAQALGTSEALTLSRRSLPPELGGGGSSANLEAVAPPPRLPGTPRVPAFTPSGGVPAPSAPGAATPSAGAARPAVSTTAPRAGEPAVSVATELPYKEARERCVDQFEREYFRTLLERYNRNVAQVAQVAGLDRTYLYRLIRKHSL